MKHTTLIIFLIVLLAGSTCFGQKTEGKQKDISREVFFGTNYAYILEAPEGWVIDKATGVSMGFLAVFYPKNSSLENAAAFMHTDVKAKRDKQTLKDVMAADIAAYKVQSTTLKIKDGYNIEFERYNRALVKYLSNNTNNNYKAIAYIDESRCVIQIVMTARTKKDFDSSLSVFEELVMSYGFFESKKK